MQCVWVSPALATEAVKLGRGWLSAQGMSTRGSGLLVDKAVEELYERLRELTGSGGGSLRVWAGPAVPVTVRFTSHYRRDVHLLRWEVSGPVVDEQQQRKLADLYYFEADDGPGHFSRRIPWPETADRVWSVAGSTMSMLWRVYGVPRGGEVRFVLQVPSSLPAEGAAAEIETAQTI